MRERSIDIAAAGRFHAHHLATAFAGLGRLRDLYLSHRGFSPPPLVPRRSFHNRLDLVAQSFLLPRLGRTDTRSGIEARFDRWLAERLERKPPGVLHAWNGSAWHTLRRLQGRDWTLCVERSCPHNEVQRDLLVEEGERLGLPFHWNRDALARAVEELHLADVIVAPSRYSAASYRDEELARKVRVNPLGANVAYQERTRKEPGWNILMVGNNFLRKGTHYLIEAFKLLDRPEARLWLRADVPPTYARRITDSRIRILPPLLPGKLQALYRAADVFVQPSIDEGCGMTTLEALGYGLPLVVTENVGSRDILEPSVCLTVPIRNPQALAQAIVSARELPGSDFDAARSILVSRNSWSACAQRMDDEIYVKSTKVQLLASDVQTHPL
jgi:glycosyltransferase involved in cell wall biosynthesis